MQITNKFISAGCNTVYHSVAYHSTKPIVAYGTSNQVNILNPETAQVSVSLNGHGKRVNVPKFFALQKEITLISGASDGSVIIWKTNGSPFDHTTWRKDFTCQLDESVVNIQIKEISETEAYIVTLTTSTVVGLWKYDGKTLELIEKLHFGTTFQEASCLEIIDDRHLFMFLGGIDKLVHIYTYDLKSTEKAQLQYHLSLKGHENAVTDFAITKVKENNEEFFLLASSSRDTLIRLWKLAKYDGEKDQMKAFQNKNNHKITLSEGNLLILSLESILSGHTDHISSICWGLKDPKKNDGSESNLYLLSTSFDFSCYLWANDKKDDLWVNRVRLGQLGGNKNAFFGAVFNGDYSEILAYTFGGALYHWKVTGEEQYSLKPTISGHFGHVMDLDWSSEGDYLISCSADQTARVFCEWAEKGTWHEISRAQIHGYDLNAIRNLKAPVRGDTKFVDYIVSGGDEKIIRMFEPSLAFINTLNTLTGKNHRLYFENEEDEAKNIDQSSKIVRYLINTEATTQVLGLMAKQIQVEQPKMSTYGEEEGGVPEEDEEGEGMQYDYSTPPVEDFLAKRTLWPELNKLYGHGYEVKALATNSTGTLIASSCKSQTPDHAALILWDPKKYNIIDRIPFHSYTAIALEFSKNDEYLVSVSRDRQIGLFKHDKDDEKHPYKLVWGDKSHSRIVWTVSFSPDVKYLMTGARDKLIKIWKLEGEKPAKVCEKSFATPVTAVAFSENINSEGKYIFVVGLESGDLHICEFDANANTITQIDSVPEYWKHSSSVNKIKFRPNTKGDVLTFATASEDFSVKVFDIVLKK